jgi:metal-dependent HD superfamily phosphatase/phosphodiesterase
MRSPKEQSLDVKITEKLQALRVSAKVMEAANMIGTDEEIQAVQEYANNVSIGRLGYNDHGPVHMRTVALNAIIMLGFLRAAGIKTSLETEGIGDFDDSLIAVIYGAMLHDLGMSMGRQDHEIFSIHLASPIIERQLSLLYKNNLQKKVMTRSLALECISGHMGNRPVYSIEAGIVQVADGCDMTKGRARISMALVYGGNLQKKVTARSLALECISGHMGNRHVYSLEAGIVQVADGCDMTKGRARISMSLAQNPRVGSIHQYSANSIEKVRLTKGHEKPIQIEVLMSSEVGLFQVEEVLLTKIASGTAKPYIELYAHVEGEEPKRYL